MLSFFRKLFFQKNEKSSQNIFIEKYRELFSEFDLVKCVLIENRGSVVFEKEVDLKYISRFIDFLEKEKINFQFYDYYFPEYIDKSMDRGSYLSYSKEFSEENDGVWSMTLGNHGWTGGIYKINKEIIVHQIFDLIKRQNDFFIQVENVGIFSHYSIKSHDKNEKEQRAILLAHTL